MALLGWIANALADPIVYAFWYPVFRKSLVKMIFKLKSRVVVTGATVHNNNNNRAATDVAAGEEQGSNRSSTRSQQSKESAPPPVFVIEC